MNDLQRLREWLSTYPDADALTDWQVDYTSDLPGSFGVFPAGLIENSRTENIWGDVTVQSQYNFALRLILPKAPGDDIGASFNADWIMDFQSWVQKQSAQHKAPTFGNIETEKETMSAQNGALFSADSEGLAMYAVFLNASFKTFYPAQVNE